MSNLNRPTSEDRPYIEGSQTTRAGSQSEGARTEDDRIVVNLIGEHLEVHKQWVQSGEVVIRKSVQTSQQTIPVELQYEQVQVDRVPVNRPVPAGEKIEPWWEGEVMVVPVVEEEIVVSKRLVIREELRITKLRATRQETVSDTIRREVLDVNTAGAIKPVAGDDPAINNG